MLARGIIVKMTRPNTPVTRSLAWITIGLLVVGLISFSALSKTTLIFSSSGHPERSLKVGKVGEGLRGLKVHIDATVDMSRAREPIVFSSPREMVAVDSVIAPARDWFGACALRAPPVFHG